MCDEQKIKTLKHELTHAYIWEHGLYNAPSFTEEMVCDLVAAINDTINEVLSEYKNTTRKQQWAKDIAQVKYSEILKEK
jgi:hypothetical protein